MHRRNSICCLLLALVVFSYAQSATKMDLRGYIHDSQSGEALPYANVWVTGTTHGSVTNADGYFVIVNQTVGPLVLTVRYIGYKPIELAVDHGRQDKPLQIQMEPTTLQGEAMTVTAHAEVLQAAENLSQLTVSPREIASLPNIGEAALFRTLQLLPGVSSVSDGSSGLYVRGGTPDQNLILFDGMTIYHVDHFFGFFSAFNADAIKDIQLYKGGFGAEYGGRLSSVVNLTGKTGDQNRIRFNYGLNLLSGHTAFQMPLKNWGTLLIAARRSYTDFIQSPLYDRIYKLVTGDEGAGATGGPSRMGGRGEFGGSQQAEFKPSFYFYDLNSKLTLRPSTRDIVTLSLYSGKDNLDRSQDLSDNGMGGRGFMGDVSFQTTDFTRWGNMGFSGKWSRQWHDRVHLDLLAAHSNYFSDYDRSTDMGGSAVAAQSDSGVVRRNFNDATQEGNRVYDTSLKLDGDWQMSSRHRLDFGAGITQFKNEYSAFRDDSISIFSRNRQALLQAFYLQECWKWNGLQFIPGIRASYYEKTKKTYYEPRVSLSWSPVERIKLQGAWGYYYQFVNHIANEDVAQGARDFWMLADEDFKPGFAEHRILGVSYENTSALLSLEAYKKEMEDLVEFSRRFVGQDRPGPREGTMNVPIENFFVGTGTARGVELLLQKKRGALSGWLGYTLAKVSHRFPVINNGEEFPANHDRRHQVSVVGQYKWGMYSFSATWVYASGNPYTAPESQYYLPLLNGQIQSYIHVSDKNAVHLPDYQRLDISVSRTFESQRWSTDIGLSIFNAYNHRNVWYKDYNLDTIPVTVTDVLMLGFTPTIYLEMRLK